MVGGYRASTCVRGEFTPKLGFCHTGMTIQTRPKSLYKNQISHNKDPAEALVDSAKNGDIRALQYLLTMGTNVNSRNSEGMTALAWAAVIGNGAAISTLIEHGGSIDLPDIVNGFTPLHYAVRNGRYITVRQLIKYGANVNLKTKTGSTPLILAVQFDNLPIVQFLIENGADVNRKDSTMSSPLIWGSKIGDDAVVDFLLHKGAEIDSADMTGMTPLMFASRSGFEKVVRVLTTHGANVTLKNKRGMTAIDFAKIAGKNELATFLISKL